MREGVEEVLLELRQLREQLEAQSSLPQLLTMERAAYELSVSLTTLKGLIRSGDVLTSRLGKRRMVPASEVRRLATPENKAGRKPPAPKSALQDSNALRRG